jgi:hypothetical protein
MLQRAAVTLEKNDLVRMGVGAAILLVLVLAFLRFPAESGPSQLRAHRLELVYRIRMSLASALEAEKIAVIAVSDEESRAFADRTRTFAAEVEQARTELATSLANGGTQAEKDALEKFSLAFVGLQQVDQQILDLAVQHTNLKAYRMTYGPATEAVTEVGAAFKRLAPDTAPASPENFQIARLATRARVAALRIMLLLPPHIGEENEKKMDHIEAGMGEEEREVRAAIDGLSKIPAVAGSSDYAAALAAWQRLGELKAEIIKLSRENTNVRSLSLSLNRKRVVLAETLEALTALERHIEGEHGGAASSGRWAVPR